MRPGAIVNVSDYNSEFYCRNGEVVSVTGSEIVVMFLVKYNMMPGLSCIVDTFNKNQLYEMVNRKVSVIKGENE